MPAIRPPKSIRPQEPPAPSLASFATQHVKVPEVQLKVKASPALVAMQKLLHQHHVPIPSKVVPKVKEAAVTPKSKASRPTPKVRMGETALSTAERLRAAVKGE